MSIWTALALLLAGLVQPAEVGEKFPLNDPGASIGGVIVGVFLVFLHCYYSKGTARANSIDKAIVLHYDRAMQKMLNLPFDANLNSEIKNLPDTKGWKQWSHLAQVSITILLAAAAVVIISVRSA